MTPLSGSQGEIRTEPFDECCVIVTVACTSHIAVQIGCSDYLVYLLDHDWRGSSA